MSATGDRIEVCDVEDLPDGDRLITEVNGVELGVFHVDGEFFAVANSCPHRNGPVCEGMVTNALEAEWPGVGSRLDERMTGDPAIACPWHGWEFDMASGEHLGDSRFSVPTYETVIEDGTVFVAP